MTKSRCDKILHMSEVVKIAGVSDKTIYRNMELGLFPKKVKIGVRCVGWLRSDVDEWLSDRKPKKDNTDG